MFLLGAACVGSAVYEQDGKNQSRRFITSHLFCTSLPAQVIQTPFKVPRTQHLSLINLPISREQNVGLSRNLP